VRLWSIHPAYLDAKGIVALWREGLLALAVLRGQTKGYKNHPQLTRFQEQKNPVASMKKYLWYVYLESRERGYTFNVEKIGRRERCGKLPVTQEQLVYELSHLREKLEKRDIARFETLHDVTVPMPHPLFIAVPGQIEQWEKVVADD